MEQSRPKGLNRLFSAFALIAISESIFLSFTEPLASAFLILVLRFTCLLPFIGLYFGYRGALWIAVCLGSFFGLAIWCALFTSSFRIPESLILIAWAVLLSVSVGYFLRIKNHVYTIATKL
jgi:hypothetical protein